MKGKSNILPLCAYDIIYHYKLIIRHNAHIYIGHIIKLLLRKENDKDHGGRMSLYQHSVTPPTRHPVSSEGVTFFSFFFLFTINL